jgi:hypothetical protein
VGLAIFNDSIQTNFNLFNNSNSFVLYKRSNGKTYASVYKLNSDGVIQSLGDLTGITTFISSSDILTIVKTINPTIKQVVLLLNNKDLFNEKVYPTDFQVKIGLYAARIVPGGGTSVSECSAGGDCKTPVVGWCIGQERQNGPTTYNCYPKKDFCPNQSTERVLNNNGYSVGSDFLSNLYSIRDNFLIYSSKGSEYIDNYYYASSILKENQINLTFALNVYDLYSSGFISKLNSILQNKTSGVIIINDNDKIQLIKLCEAARLIDNDERFQNIINIVEADIVKYTLKTYNEIKVDF